MTSTKPILLFIVIATNAGGEGKTLVGKLFKALLRLSGRTRVKVLDADVGNWACKMSDQNAVTVGWGVPKHMAPHIVDDCAGHHVILDPGANAFAGSRDFADLVSALVKEFGSRQYRVLFLHPVSTNKYGALESVSELANTLAGPEQYMVRVNRDGSGHYVGDESRLQSRPTIDVPHLAPGFQQVLQAHADWDDALVDPEPGYDRASDYIGQWFSAVANQQTVQGILGTQLSAHLPTLYEPVPKLLFVCRHKHQCSDTELPELERRSGILAFLDSRAWSPEALREAADRFP